MPSLVTVLVPRSKAGTITKCTLQTGDVIEAESLEEKVNTTDPTTTVSTLETETTEDEMALTEENFVWDNQNAMVDEIGVKHKITPDHNL
jgi:hypothetical protein